MGIWPCHTKYLGICGAASSDIKDMIVASIFRHSWDFLHSFHPLCHPLYDHVFSKHSLEWHRPHLFVAFCSRISVLLARWFECPRWIYSMQFHSFFWICMLWSKRCLYDFWLVSGSFRNAIQRGMHRFNLGFCCVPELILPK